MSGEDYQKSLEMFNKNIPKNFVPEYEQKKTHTQKWMNGLPYQVKEEQEKDMEIYDSHNSFYNHNSRSISGEGDPLQYTIQYLDDDNDVDDDDDDNNDDVGNNAEQVYSEGKGYRNFLVADYVDYNKETNISKCLIRNCEKPLSGRRTGNIKRHYEKVHNFVIVHGTREKRSEEVATKSSCITVNLDKYFDYDPLMNKSYCKMPGCTAALMSSKPNNIMRHYSLVHNFKIGAEGEENKSVSMPADKEVNAGTLNVPLEELVVHDMNTHSYQCLFLTCQEVLDKEITSVERHYYEIHKIVIARNAENIPNRFYRKRMYRYVHQPFENDQEYLETKIMEYMQQTNSGNIKMEQEEQPHCSKHLITFGKRGFGRFDVRKYVEFDPQTNISKCMIKHCKRSMSGCLVGNIKRHYLTMHNFVVLHGSRIPFNEFEEMSDVTRDQIEDLVTYDHNSSYYCLFMNCAAYLEDDLFSIKKHYLEIHKILIVRYSDYIVQRKRRYKELQQQHLPETDCFNEEGGSQFDHFSESNDNDCDMQVEEEEKVNYGKMCVVNYIEYDPEKNISKCLIKRCNRSMRGCLVGNIKRHYLTMHNFVILHGTRPAYQENDNDLSSLQDDLLPYYIEISSQQCLFMNCNQILEKNLPQIKKHYHEVHKIIINKETHKVPTTTTPLYRGKALSTPQALTKNPETILPDDEEEEEHINTSVMEQKLYSPTSNALLATLGRKGFGKFNMGDYVDYDKEKNLAKCLIKHCKRSMSGLIVGNIKRHYKRMHNFVILHGIRLPNDEFQEIFDPSIVEELVSYDIATSSYQCIFNNCSQILEKDLAALKRHYCNSHKVAIAKDAECGGGKRGGKRRYHELFESGEFLEDESCSVRNEYLSEEEDDTSNHHINLTDYLEESMNYPIKKEFTSDNEEEGENDTLNTLHNKLTKPNATTITGINENHFKQQNISNLKATHPKIANLLDSKPILNVQSPVLNQTPNISSKPNNRSTNANIDLTKQTFLNLCLGLVIERHMPLHYFDDDKYFKPLLGPYEQVFACDINASKVRNIMAKANHLIMEDLRKRFNNKIICLELYVLKAEGRYYVIINVRYLEDEMICNKLLGSFPLTETTKQLPFKEYLNKFNIDEQQVYMKTIMPEFLNEEEIYNICNNICKHNSDIKNHPIYELQTIFRTYIKKYFNDIKNWQALSGYKESEMGNRNMLEDLKEFSKFLEDKCSESEKEIELQTAQLYFKALQILWNFLEKLNGEQYVSGDFYRDWLCCELGLKGEHNKNQNSYAEELYKEFCDIKIKILESREFVAALYLDARFNFLGTRLIGEEEQNKGKLYLCEIWEKFKNYLRSSSDGNTEAENSNAELNTEDFNDDEYALLTQHINDTMTVKTNVSSIQYKLSQFVPTKRQPISMDILKYWHTNCLAMEDINELTKIAFTHSASQYVLIYLQNNFAVPPIAGNDSSDKFDMLLLKHNQKIIEENIEVLLEDL